jgi:hypothetical protein
MDLINELKQLLFLLNENKIEFALCGGLAMAVYSFPRATLDIDIMIKPEDLDRTKRVVKELDFSIDSGLMQFKKGKILMHRLCKLEDETHESLVLDLLLVTPELNSIWESRQNILWEEGMLTVVSPQGLIQLKSFRRSGQDKDDIEFLRKLIDES